ncbi:SpoIIE family protein phosphatase [Streptomyces sp. NPDC047928]|uniref:SpoIIE family protein phosphatase n=1 Tax=unclassified Streptomyces TaxID=2593676 RepID=UPI0037143E99
MVLRSVAGQVFVLQLVVVVVLVGVAVLALVSQARNQSTQEARQRSLAVAETFVNSSPAVREALKGDDPTAVLQPRAEATRKLSGVDYVVVFTPAGIRLTHPDPDLIGKHVFGTYEEGLAGESHTSTFEGSLGPAVDSTVPVIDTDGRVVGLVSVGITVENVNEAMERRLPLLLGAAAVVIVFAAGGSALVSRRLRRQTHGLGPAEMTRMYEHHDAVLHCVREGVLIVGGDGRLLLANDEARRLLDLPPDAEGRHVGELGLEPRTAELLASGRVATDEVHPAGDRLLAVSHRPTDQDGGPPGSVATLRDTTELRELSGRVAVARERLRLLYDAGMGIGTTLDVRRTAQELAEVAVPRFADFVTVDLADQVLRGEEPPAGAEVRRTAIGGIRTDHPLYPEGELIRYRAATPQARCLAGGRAVLDADLNASSGWREQDPARGERLLDYGIHSLVTVPLRARGVVLGLVGFWRSERPEPFEEDDLALAEEIVTRAAVCVDNARRYTREHAMAVTLQRSLLPSRLAEQDALDVAYRYLPAPGAGGDWFDVIALPGARVALVVGDVVGHGVHAAATMGRLRTAVHNFSTLDLPPDELLAHLDHLVEGIDQSRGVDGEMGITGATCLYAIYDPASGTCSMARAGHPLPALVHPDGRVEFPDVPAGPPLGLGGLPFETAEFRLPEGSELVLYTNGLVQDRDRGIDVGLDLLSRALAHPGRTPDETCEAVLAALRPARAGDDVVLLVARTRMLDPGQVAVWDVPRDASAVSRVRADVTRQLARWELDDVAFTTELILSELVTNAIRYAREPIRVRLLRDQSLICEVSDASSTAPHLRYAATTDEGGRGLFLVAQVAERWGTRYTAEGKVIWSEQRLRDGAASASATALGDALMDQLAGGDDSEW